ncbi:MAG: hypothetical protein ACI4SL_04090, partial [Candidatus Ornithospirochaeta sp.]
RSEERSVNANKGGAPSSWKTRERRCIVKITFSGPIVTTGNCTIDPSHPNAQKLAYISRSTATKENVPWHEEKNEKVLYSFNDLGLKESLSFEEASKRIGDGPVFRIILSPEKGNECNLEELSRRFIKDSVAPALHTPLYRLKYVAANHWNTDNPHVHIIVARGEFNKARGGIEDNSLVRFSKDYIRSHKAMKDASAISNEIAGPIKLVDLSIEERTNAKETRLLPIDLLLMDLGREREDGIAEITDKELLRLNKDDRKIAVSRLKELCHMKMGYGMSVEEKPFLKGKKWVFSPFFWTKLRILCGDDSIPVEEKELGGVIIDSTNAVPVGKQVIISQDDKEEDKVFVRFVDEEEKIHLTHVKDGSEKIERERF